MVALTIKGARRILSEIDIHGKSEMRAILIRGALLYQIRSFLNIVQKGGCQTHVQNFVANVV